MSDPTLLQVFSTIMARLTKLEFYTDTIDIDEGFVDFSINEIETAIFRYPPKDSIKRIDVCLNKIKVLKEKGESIVSAVIVVELDNKLEEEVPVSDIRAQEKKRWLYESILVELIFYELKLTNIKESLILNLTLDAQFKEKKSNLTTKIPPDELILDMRQFALLFYYLREFKVIQPQHNDELASYLSLLSGFETKIRTTRGLGVIPGIKSDKVVNKRKKGETSFYNLNSVKNTLNKIINQIDSDIVSEMKRI